MGFNENSFGLVVNLYQNDRMNLLIGALLLNPRNRLSEGAKVNGICRLASIIDRQSVFEPRITDE